MSDSSDTESQPDINEKVASLLGENKRHKFLIVLISSLFLFSFPSYFFLSNTDPFDLFYNNLHKDIVNSTTSNNRSHYPSNENISSSETIISTEEMSKEISSSENHSVHFNKNVKIEGTKFKQVNHKLRIISQQQQQNMKQFYTKKETEVLSGYSEKSSSDLNEANFSPSEKISTSSEQVSESSRDREVNPKSYPVSQEDLPVVYNLGEVRNVGNPNLCLDARLLDGSTISLYDCHGQAGNQEFILNENHELGRSHLCADYFGGPIFLFKCHSQRGNQMWNYTQKQNFHHPTSNTCLTISENLKLVMKPCTDSKNQKWWYRKTQNPHQFSNNEL